MKSKLLGLALLGSLLLVVRADEDEVEGENGEEWEDNSVYKAIIESCSGWRLNKLPEVKNFIYGDFESKYDRTVFKKIPGKAPEMIFYTQSGKELERLNIEKFDRYIRSWMKTSKKCIYPNYNCTSFSREELNKMLVAKGIPLKAKHDEV